MKSFHWGRIAAVTVTMLALLVGAHFLYMVVYSHVLDKGHDHAYYQSYAIKSGPYFAAIVGPLLMTWLCWLFFRGQKGGQVAQAMTVAALILALDGLVLTPLFDAAWSYMVVVSHLGKFAGAYFGGRLAEFQTKLAQAG